jgi:hypothetical protein
MTAYYLDRTCPDCRAERRPCRAKHGPPPRPEPDPEAVRRRLDAAIALELRHLARTPGTPEHAEAVRRRADR